MTRSEGELEKRMRLGDVETKRWGDGYRTFVAQDTIENALDEAREEYHYGMPIILFPEVHDEELRKFLADSLKLLECTMQEKDEWFLKYLGSKKAEK